MHPQQISPALSSAPSLNITMSSRQRTAAAKRTKRHLSTRYISPAFQNSTPLSGEGWSSYYHSYANTHNFSQKPFYRCCSLCRPSKQLGCKPTAKNATHTASQRHYPISRTADSRPRPTPALMPQQRTCCSHAICCLRAHARKGHILDSPPAALRSTKHRSWPQTMPAPVM